jgi:DNA repair exonuclease SbcCD ATPase subunit
MQLLAEISTKRERLRLLERRKKEIARLFARKEELLNHEKERAADESAPEIPPGENPSLAPANVATAAAPLPRHSHTAAAAVTKAPLESMRKQIEEIKSMLRLAIKRRSASGAQLAESLASLSAETFTIAERQQKLEREVDDLRHLSAKLTKRLHAQGLTAGETAQPAVSESESAEGTAGSEGDLLGQLHHWLGKLQALRDKHPHAVRVRCEWCL